MLVTVQLPVAIGFHTIFPHTMEVNGDQQLFGYPHSSEYQTEEIHTGLAQHMGYLYFFIICF